MCIHRHRYRKRGKITTDRFTAKKRRTVRLESDDEGGERERPAAPAEGEKETEPETTNKDAEGDSSDDELAPDSKSAEMAGGMSDFELMLARKRDERRGKRRRRDIDIINDNDDLIAHLLQQMRLAAEEDRDLNKRNQPAVKKVPPPAPDPRAPTRTTRSNELRFARCPCSSRPCRS